MRKAQKSLNAMTRFENMLEGLVERSFARFFRARLQPVEIAKRLSREMEIGRIVGVSTVLVPNDFEVALSAEDYASFAPMRGSLEQEIVSYLTDFARDHRFGLLQPPVVHIVSDPTLHARQMSVAARMTEDPNLPPPRPAPAPPRGPVSSPPPQARTERLEPTRQMPALPREAPPAAEPAVPGEAYLTLGGVTYPLAGSMVTLGRGLENTIVLEDRRISRVHAVLTCANGLWSVRDEGSTNGTFVSDRTVAQHTLRNGDRVSLGGLEFVFHQRWSGS